MACALQHAIRMPIGELSHNYLRMDLENHLFFLCTQVVYRRNAALQEVLRPLGLQATEFRVLSALLRRGPLTMLELAQWTAYERTRITHMLHGMEEKGWVERTSSAHDKRTVVAQITFAGRKLFEAAKVEVDRLTDEVMSGNSAEELELVRAALRTMRGKMIDMGL